jgi:hypothetical protein
MHIRPLFVGAAVTAILFGSVALPADAVAAKSYPNCNALNKVYAHGVGKQGAVDKTSGKKVTNFKVSTKIYNLNNGPHKAGGREYDLDRDNDGIACEKR